MWLKLHSTCIKTSSHSLLIAQHFVSGISCYVDQHTGQNRMWRLLLRVGVWSRASSVPLSVWRGAGGHGRPQDAAGVWQIQGWKSHRLWPISHPADARTAEPARQVRDANWQRVYSVTEGRTDAELSAWKRARAVVQLFSQFSDSWAVYAVVLVLSLFVIYCHMIMCGRVLTSVRAADVTVKLLKRMSHTDVHGLLCASYHLQALQSC